MHVVLTLFMTMFAGRADEVRFDRGTWRRFKAVSQDICRGYLEFLNPLAGVREWRTHTRGQRNLEVFTSEDDLVANSTHPDIRPVHSLETALLALAEQERLVYRVLVNRRRLYVKNEGLVEVARGSVLLIDPVTKLVVSIYPGP